MEAITTELLPSPDQKRDAKGHRYYAREVKERLLREYRASGLTQRAFAEKVGVKFCTLSSWIQGVRMKGTEVMGTREAVFTEVKLAAPKLSACAVEVVLFDGTKISGADVKVVAELVRELRRR